MCETNFFFNHILLIHSKKNDPSTGVWNISAHMIYNRYKHTASVLMNEAMLITGGFGSTGNYLNASELFQL